MSQSDGAAAPGGRACRNGCGGLVAALALDASRDVWPDRNLAVHRGAIDRRYHGYERRTAIIAGATVMLTIAAGAWYGHVDASYWIRVTAVCAMGLLAVVLAGVRCRREERLARMTAIAKASQVALLPPMPPEITGIGIVARYRSATPGAWVGGDLYEIIATGHGIRVIIGDVRGNGLDAVLLARHVLSAFRRRAVAVPALEHVAGEVSRAIRPHLGEEDFVTAALVQLAPGGELTVVNCGHHPPLLHHSGGLRPLTGTTAPPLGLEEDFTAFTASWRPGDRLLLYTDGLVESRNQHGDFLPEDQIATALLAADCDQALDALMTAVRRHTGGRGHDDIALLLLEHDADPHSNANKQPAQAAAKTVIRDNGPITSDNPPGVLVTFIVRWFCPTSRDGNGHRSVADYQLWDESDWAW